MNREDFAAFQDQVYTQLETDKRPARMIIRAKVAQRIHAAVATLYYGAPAILVCAGANLLGGPEMGIVFPTIGGGVIGAMILGMISEHIERNGGMTPDEKTRDLILSTVRAGYALDPSGAEQVSEWVGKYPRILEICVKWGARNKDHTLNTYDTRKLGRAVNSIEDAQKLHAVWLKGEEDRKKVEDALSKHGLLDRIKSTAQHAQLAKETSRTSAISSPKRI